MTTTQPVSPPASGDGLAPPRGRRRARRVATIVGVVGLIGCIVLALGVLAGRGWASDQVGAVFAGVDEAVARGGTLAGEASSRSAERAAQLDELIASASALDPGSRLPAALTERLANVAAAYDAVRGRYAEIRAEVASAVRILDAVGRFVPALEIPSAPREALSELDQRLVEIDGNLSQLRSRASDATVNGVVEAATALRATVDRVTAATERITAATDDLRERLDRAQDRLDLYVWLAAGGLLLILLYVALLNLLVIWLARD